MAINPGFAAYLAKKKMVKGAVTPKIVKKVAKKSKKTKK